jgi:Flp pilus assembly protein CpaB
MSEQPRPERQLNVPVLAAGIVVAVLGFAASVYLGSQGHTTGGAPTKQVLVASHDLAARSTLSAGDVQPATFAAADVPPGAFVHASDVVGKVAQVSILANQPLLANELGTAGDVAAAVGAFLPLTKGEVGATVPTGELVGVGGYIKPGDYINLIAVVPSRGGGFANVRTIYSGVRVIRTGSAASAPNADATSLTLQVSECQYEFISWFIANASLKYTLLSSSDYATASQAPPDTACPATGSAGVSEADIKNRWPGLVPTS